VRPPLKFTERVLHQIQSHARAEQPLECCGLLAGPQEVITETFPTKNALASPHDFWIDPRELITTLRTLRERGLKHLGIYHSHPQSENTPSSRDIELAFYPSCAYVIICPKPSAPRPVRAFTITNDRAMELEIESVVRAFTEK
jgi:[CysO sulfur-carrier protein]-S-L-cysteine hydrolase